MSTKKNTYWKSNQSNSILFSLGTICPRSSDPYYIVSYCIKWVTTSWTYSRNNNNIMSFTLLKHMYSDILTFSYFSDTDENRVIYKRVVVTWRGWPSGYHPLSAPVKTDTKSILCMYTYSLPFF